MKILSILLACCLLAAHSGNARADRSARQHSATRHKSGPSTIRGIAHHVHAKGFTLETPSKGSYAVDTSPPTTFVEKGHTGKLTLAENTHVGVRGFVHGRTIRAIEVRLYAVQPKPYTVRGTVSSIRASQLTIRTGSSSLVVVLTAKTELRTSSGPLSASLLQVGDRVEARVRDEQSHRVALHVHVFRQRAKARHVILRGTVVSASDRVLTIVSSGKRYQLRLDAKTKYYGHGSPNARALRPAEVLTIYACCEGHPLVATSVHLHVVRGHRHLVEVKGQVLTISNTVLRVDSARTTPITLDAATRYEVGSTPASRSALRVGDHVAVRADAAGSTLRATRVHVYDVYRRPRIVRGVLSAAPSGRLSVADHGRLFTLEVDAHTVVRLEGRAVSVTQLHAGDRIKARGLPAGKDRLRATDVEARRPPPKRREIRGTVAQLNGTTLIVLDSFGTRQSVRFTSATHVQLGGKPVAMNALFAGLRVVVRATVSGTTLYATQVTAETRMRIESGRLTAQAPTSMVIRRAAGREARIDVPPGISVSDGSHRIRPASLHVGAYLRVVGYEEVSKSIRAVSLAVLHPQLLLRGVLSLGAGSVTLQTSRGDRYGIRLGSRTEILSMRGAIPLRLMEIPSGSMVRVAGTVGSDGMLTAASIDVRLKSVRLRTHVVRAESDGLELRSDLGTRHVRYRPDTTFLQGARSIDASSIVPGDDVTIEGYGIAAGGVLARTVIVHRRLEALDGTVASIEGQSFVLTATDGPHHILVSDVTVVSGPAGMELAVGMQVHVTGYVRGDGVVLATRIRLGKRL